MSDVNRKPNVVYPVKAAIAPQSVAAAATVVSAWIAVGSNKWAQIQSLAGAGAGAFAVKIEQATAIGGTGAKDLATAAQVGITAQAAASIADAGVDLSQLIDTDGGFAFIRLSATCTGGAGTLYGAGLALGPAAYQA